MKTKLIYLDNAATTPVDTEVLKAMLPYFSEKYGNASSLHKQGQEARNAIEKSREEIAKFLNCKAEEIIFTGSGTESNNAAIKGIAFFEKGEKNHIIVSKIEHHSVLEPCKFLEKKGFKITYLDVDKDGLVDVEDIEKAITPKTLLVSIMHANNEIGTIQPIEEIGKICRKHKIFFHSDAIQTFGKLQIDVKKMNLDMLSASAHKIYGPKGVGLLYVNQVKLGPLLHGGGQEFGLRSGTENVAGIVGFAKAIEICKKNMQKDEKRIIKLRDKLIKEILKIPRTRLNGHATLRLYNNANFSFYGIEGESLVMHLDMHGIAASTGSACSTRTLEPSHVLKAIGLSNIEAHGSLRLTLGRDTKENDINYTINVIKNVVKNLRKISPIK